MYNPLGYDLLKYRSGESYYGIETAVHNHELLRNDRIRCPHTNKITEWFSTNIEIVETVVEQLVTIQNNLDIYNEVNFQNSHNDRTNNEVKISIDGKSITLSLLPINSTEVQNLYYVMSQRKL